MRHRLAQLSSREENPPAAACSPPSSCSPGEAGHEAEALHEEEAAVFLEEPDDGGGSGNEELLFPAGLELDDWLEAAVAAEARPDWETSEDGAGSPSHPGVPWVSSQPPASRPSRRPGSNRVKAAAAARLNRQKKKQYVLGLETRLQGLAAENRQLRDRNRGLGRRLRDLERETSYLRAVLANQSALGRILSHLAGGRAGLRIRSSLFEDQRQPPPSRAPLEGRLSSWESSSNSSSSSDHDYALPVPEEEEEDKRAFPPSSPGGICLHVDWDQVSIEFCSACARRAASSALAAAPPAKMCLPCQAPLCRG